MIPLAALILSAAGVGGLAYTLGAHLIASAGIGTVHRGPASRRAVALTFDDGPDPIHTPRILDTLAQYHARATFFIVGERAQKHPEIVRAIAAGQHEIGNHTFTHPHLWSGTSVLPGGSSTGRRIATPNDWGRCGCSGHCGLKAGCR